MKDYYITPFLLLVNRYLIIFLKIFKCYYIDTMTKDRILGIFKQYFPYLVLVVASLISCYIYFLPGIAGGDDIAFHLSMVNDVIYGIKHGYFGLSTNHLFMGGFALYNFGFYGPTTHYGAGLFVVLFSWAGATPLVGLKFMILASGLLGGIYMYKLAYKMSNGHRVVALVSSALFVFLPYRIFCALARCAFAESIAMALIPMVFYGAYSFLHDKEYRVEPYVAFAVGAALIVLSHPFTGLITAIFGALYFLFNIKAIYNNRKNYRALISLGATIVVTVCLVLFYVANASYCDSLNYYNVSDDVRQWTTYEHVAKETARSYDFSGFLNIIYIRNAQGAEWWNKETVSSLLFSTALYFISMLFAVVLDTFLKPLKYSKFYRHPSALIMAFFLPLVFRVRIEIFLALAVSLLIYFFISFLISKLPSSNEESAPLYKNIDLYFLIISIIVCLILIFVPTSWYYVPSILYKGQFAWRMWSITAFLVAMLVTLILSRFKANTGALIGTAIIACSIVTLTMGTFEKRVYYEVRPQKVITNDGYDYAIGIKYSGVQNEMVPQIFEKNDYVSNYSNSLYTKVKNAIHSHNNFIYSAEEYYDPAFLEGTGTFEIYEYNSPNNRFHVNITSDTALVQLPQFYYQGYFLYSGSTLLGEAKNVDGLVAFELKQGTYDVAINFKGAPAYRITRPFFYVGVFSLVAGGVFGLIYRTKLMKKKPEEETAN